MKHPARPGHGRLTIRTPVDFGFWSTVRSHGWYSLPPFSCDLEQRILTRVLRLSDGTLVHCTLSGSHRSVLIRYTADRPLAGPQQREIRSALASCLRLDEDLRPFHRAMRSEPEHRWIPRTSAGRLLRSPTVFEDLVRMICTTNCTWGLTTLMVSNLVHSFGPSSGQGWHGFPEPESIAGHSEAFLRRHIKSGYRTPYLISLSESVASGQLNPELWRTPPLDSERIRASLLSVRGIGPYAAENMLRLLGSYEDLALDSWVRSKYYSIYHRGRKVSDRTIRSRYARFGRWRGLVFWLEMTREWHDEKFPR